MKHFPRRFAVLAALVCGSLLLSTRAAQAGGHGGGARRPPPKVAYTAIISVDPTAKTITIGPKNSTATGTKTYKFTEKTVVTQNGKPGTFSDLVAGQRISVGTGMDEGVAEELKVSTPPADPAPPAGHGSSTNTR